MIRLFLALLFVVILLIGFAIVATAVRAVTRGAGQTSGLDIAESGMLPKIAYVLLLGLILYVSFGGGS
ncbi:hypothetical protein [Pseudoruegeria sp. HB172150]|uniref:hypothetical protein n=1 Tax=Pseudoruegeria sp. HB172150 TaxID=2721164 RepID=UPI001554A190|nr:hypothetical protein [Pseudoruegeria sp. HB172150]